MGLFQDKYGTNFILDDYQTADYLQVQIIKYNVEEIVYIRIWICRKNPAINACIWGGRKIIIPHFGGEMENLNPR